MHICTGRECVKEIKRKKWLCKLQFYQKNWGCTDFGQNLYHLERKKQEYKMVRIHGVFVQNHQ